MNKLETLKNILDEAQEKKIWSKRVTVYGYQFDYETTVISGLSKYWFGKHEVEERICSLDSEGTNRNRPGTKKASTEYIVIHDTASTSPTADEYAHATYVANGGGGTSWHYSVGEHMACHQVPDDEVAYHAGDSLLVPFCLIPTGVKGKHPHPVVTIEGDYYYIDGKKSQIKIPKISYVYEEKTLVFASDDVKQVKKAPVGASEGEAFIHPQTEDINDAGIGIVLGSNGFYYMGPTYYNATYQKIANRGGNLHSIGIETMVNQGSHLMRTWHRCAKLVAHLLVQNQLTVDQVKPHHFFSGKPCPQTLRSNQLWDEFISYVNVEYQILKDFSDVSIELEVNHPKIDKDGLIQEELERGEIITYQVRLIDQQETLVLNYTTTRGE